jgi:eukaryotic-like serine/threonine-protein kinase
MPTSGPHPDTDKGLFQLIRTRAGARRLAQFAFDPTLREESNAGPALAGGYVGVRVLGEGASGVVYLATHPETQRLVAFKLFQRLGRKAADRAHREIEVLAELRLSCVPFVHGYGQSEGQFYLATDYIDGPSLEDHCRVGNLTVRQNLELLLRIAEAVQAIHERGVLHRDLKPSNIIVRNDGVPIIVDFGIARLVEPSADELATQEGQPLGTPAFMSPEQARGDQPQVTVRSDVYSLGAIGYWMLTGQPPVDVECSYAEALGRIIEQPPRHPRELKAGLPRELAAILHRAVQSDPERRTPSAADLATDLQHYLRGEPLSWTPMAPWRQLLYWAKMHRPAAAILLLCLIGYAATAIATAIALERASFAAERAEYATQRQQLLDDKEQIVAKIQRKTSGWAPWLERGNTDPATFQSHLRILIDDLNEITEGFPDPGTEAVGQTENTESTQPGGVNEGDGKE